MKSNNIHRISLSTIHCWLCRYSKTFKNVKTQNIKFEKTHRVARRSYCKQQHLDTVLFLLWFFPNPISKHDFHKENFVRSSVSPVKKPVRILESHVKTNPKLVLCIWCQIIERCNLKSEFFRFCEFSKTDSKTNQIFTCTWSCSLHQFFWYIIYSVFMISKIKS